MIQDETRRDRVSEFFEMGVEGLAPSACPTLSQSKIDSSLPDGEGAFLCLVSFLTDRKGEVKWQDESLRFIGKSGR